VLARRRLGGDPLKSAHAGGFAEGHRHYAVQAVSGEHDLLVFVLALDLAEDAERRNR
jgi:hypothetical protein